MIKNKWNTKNIIGSKKAFSLLEILLVVTMIAILAGIFAPAFGNLFYRNNLDSAAEKVKTDLFRAQTLAQSAKDDSNWGVYLSPSLVTLFSGSSYASRNTANDESTELAGNIFFLGNTETIFEKSDIKPLTPGTITIRQGSEEKIININSYGLIY